MSQKLNVKPHMVVRFSQKNIYYIQIITLNAQIRWESSENAAPDTLSQCILMQRLLEYSAHFFASGALGQLYNIALSLAQDQNLSKPSRLSTEAIQLFISQFTGTQHNEQRNLNRALQAWCALGGRIVDITASLKATWVTAQIWCYPKPSLPPRNRKNRIWLPCKLQYAFNYGFIHLLSACLWNGIKCVSHGIPCFLAVRVEYVLNILMAHHRPRIRRLETIPKVLVLVLLSHCKARNIT